MTRVRNEKLKNLPTSPGIYLMKDRSKTIIYVGKAKNLKNRVRSYFNRSNVNHRSQMLIREIVDFDIIITQTEVEALLLERSLIRHHSPRYNIDFKDDKEYPYVRIDTSKSWPRIEKVRKMKDDDAIYIGPFGNTGALNHTLRSVFRGFPIVRCTESEFKRATRPCHYYHMKMCLAPCCLEVSKPEYLEMIDSIISVLRGEGQFLIQSLTEKMVSCSQLERFEQAARYRDQIEVVQKLGSKQSAVIQEIKNADGINFYQVDTQISLIVLIVRNHRLLASESFMLDAPFQNQDDILTSFILQYYTNRLVPPLIILPFSIKDKKNIQLAIEKKVMLHRCHSKAERNLLKLAHKNARHHFATKTNVRQSISTELELLQEKLSLSQLPVRIECIDISNLGDTAIVAASVCFLNGKKSPQHYRRYQISQGNQNDFAAIEEAVTRRMKRGIIEDNMPNLLVIDGGKGQLSAAAKALKQFPNLTIDLVGLAKSRHLPSSPQSTMISKSKERIYFLGSPKPLTIDTDTPYFRLLSKVRDEAHRFAIRYHRQKRSKTLTLSPLEEIKGIGPAIRRRLITHFGTLDRMKAASPEQITQINGVSKKMAQSILKKLNRQEDS